MDPINREQSDYGEEEYDGHQRMQYHQGAAIPALADEEMIGEDDEYDDLYNDVNVGESFMQVQQSEMQIPAPMVENKINPSGNGNEAMPSLDKKNFRLGNDRSYGPPVVQFPEQKEGFTALKETLVAVDHSQRGRIPDVAHITQSDHLGYQGPGVMSNKTTEDQVNNSDKIVGDPPSLAIPNMVSSKGIPHAPFNTNNLPTDANASRSVDMDHLNRPSSGNGNTMLYVGELHWWTTDAELESVLIQYGKVKDIKFFDERASGKSKGYCQVEFYDPAAAYACKEGMNGHLFNGRACVVAFATPQTIKQMGASYMNKNQGQGQSQIQGRNAMNDGAGHNIGTNYPSGDDGRNFGRGGWGRGGNQALNRGSGAGNMRGRGGIGNKTMPPAGGGGNYGQGIGGPGFGGPPGMMHPQGMMPPGFDITFMNRGAGYGNFSSPAFPGMIPPFPGVNTMGLPGVAPHVNPAFFSRGMAPNGMGLMGSSLMAGPPGMWNDPNMGGMGGDEHGRGTGESSYGGEDNASEYGHADASHDKGGRSSAASREKERNSERDWSNNPDKRHREERERDTRRYDRDTIYREEKSRYREHSHRDRDAGYDDDWERGQSSRSHSRSGAAPEDDHRSRSRDADYGKRRRMPSE